MVTNNNDLLKFKSDILKILNEHSGSCLCGHNEWCDRCSPSSQSRKLISELKNYLNCIK